MLKKALSVFMFVTLVSFVFAQSGSENTGNEAIQPIVPIQIQEHSGYYDYINDIEFRFCNKWEEKTLWTSRDLMTIDNWENKKLCLVFFNRWDKLQKIYYWYWSAEISPNNGLPMCNNIGQWDFPKMLVISGKDVLDIPAGATIIKYDKLFLPIWMGSWIQHGCINFGLKKEEVVSESKSNAMFAIQTRKAAGLDILVNWVASLKNSVGLDIQTWSMFITNKKIKAVKNSDGTVSLSISVINQGNVDQNISITGKISNFLWYQEDLITNSQTLGAYQTLEFTHILKNIPAYKGLFNVEMYMHNMPSFNVDVSELPKSLLQGDDIHETWKLFVFSWWWVGAIIILVFVLVRFVRGLFTKKQDKSVTIVQPSA